MSNNSTLEIKSNSIYIQFTISKQQTGNISPLLTHPPTSSLLTTFLLQLDNSNNNNNKYTEDNNSNNSDNDNNNRNDSKQSRIKQVVRNIEEYFTEFSHFQYSPPVCYKIEEGEEEKEMEDNKKVKYVVVFPSVVEAKIAISNLHLRYASFIPTYLHFSFGPVIGYEIAKLRRRKMISTLTTNQQSNKISSNGNDNGSGRGSGSGNGEDSNKLQIPRMMMSTKYCLLSPPPSPPPNWKPLEERAIVKNEKGEKGMKVGFDLAEPKLIDEVKLQCGSSLKTFLLHSSVEFFHPLIPSPDNSEDDDDVIYDATTAFTSSCGNDGDDDNNDNISDDDEIEKVEPPTIILTVIEKC